MKSYNWNTEYSNFLEDFKKLGEQGKKSFDEKIIYTNYEILGIRTPFLHKMAREIKKGDYLSFLNATTHQYYEEILLEGFVIGMIKEQEIFFPFFERFLSFIDNWAVCDLVIGKTIIFSKYNFISYAISLLKKEEPFQVRVGIVILMKNYLTKENIAQILNEIKQIKSDNYYVNMAIAWLISEAYVKFPNKIIAFLSHTKLTPFIYQKSISKICDSKRVTKEEKEALKLLKNARVK